MIDVAKLRSSIDTMEQLIQHHAPNLPSKIPWVGASSFLLIEYIRVSLERRDFFFQDLHNSLSGRQQYHLVLRARMWRLEQNGFQTPTLLDNRPFKRMYSSKKTEPYPSKASSPKKRFFTESRLIFFYFLWYLDVGPDNSTRDCLQVAWRKHRLDRFYFNK